MGWPRPHVRHPGRSTRTGASASSPKGSASTVHMASNCAASQTCTFVLAPICSRVVSATAAASPGLATGLLTTIGSPSESLSSVRIAASSPAKSSTFSSILRFEDTSSFSITSRVAACTFAIPTTPARPPPAVRRQRLSPGVRLVQTRLVPHKPQGELLCAANRGGSRSRSPASTQHPLRRVRCPKAFATAHVPGPRWWPLARAASMPSVRPPAAGCTSTSCCTR